MSTVNSDSRPVDQLLKFDSLGAFSGRAVRTVSPGACWHERGLSWLPSCPVYAGIVRTRTDQAPSRGRRPAG